MLYLLALLAVLAILGLLELHRAVRGSTGDRSDLDWLPARLLDAELLWSEKEFRCLEPIAISMRLDRAYRSPDGRLTLIEFKHRPLARSYPSDVVELSVQRYVLQKAGYAVDQRAYVVVIPAGGGIERALPVVLEDAREVERRAARLQAIKAGKVVPAGSAHPAVCRECGHRDACPLRR